MFTVALQNPDFVPKSVVLLIHKKQITRFGGSDGLRDEGLLESALSQPEQTFFGKLLHPTIHEQAGAYLYHLAKNHAFVDGNKRIALATTITFLQLNGYRLTLPKDQVHNLVIDVVEGKVAKEDLANILGQHLELIEK